MIQTRNLSSFSCFLCFLLLLSSCNDEIAKVCHTSNECNGGVCETGKCLVDLDGDGIPDYRDNCPDAPNPNQGDADQDLIGDLCDTDRDGDGRSDTEDNCPAKANPDQDDMDSDGLGDECDPDRDGDTIPNEDDNCPNTPNIDQADIDGDRVGDACAGDRDGDGRPDAEDNCPGVANPDQADMDSDGVGDACDPDRDGDTIPNLTDNCENTPNTDQKDMDDDGAGDACDADRDGDTIANEIDNCPDTPNPDQKDADGDGAGDACDNDTDGDGKPDGEDNCPLTPNPDQRDADQDGIGDACDEDTTFRTDGPKDPDCQYRPPVAQFSPEPQFAWDGTTEVSPEKDQVMMTPAVANLTDDNADGWIDERDTPDIIFVTFNVSGNGLLLYGLLRAISGDDGREIFTAADVPENRLAAASNVAVGDIDNDWRPEIVAVREYDGMIAFSSAGERFWSCADHGDCERYLHSGITWGGPAIADLDGDGNVEVFYGAAVRKGEDGTLLWKGSAGAGDNGVGPISTAADLDGDGMLEVVAGNTAYNHDGSVLWSRPELADGFPAVADMDADGEPEVVVAGGGKIRMVDTDGSPVWEQTIPIDQQRVTQIFGIADCYGSSEKACKPGGGPPTIADFDGDAEPEIGLASRWYYAVYETTGDLLWDFSTIDYSSAYTGSSVFDFEGDGKAEVVYNDEKKLRIFDGETGAVLWEADNNTATAYENPVIADVDNDGNAEIVVCSNNFNVPDPNARTGIRVFGDASDNWVRTRRIWNQHTYHVTNVFEDGVIPMGEIPSWIYYNSFRQNSPGQDEGTAVDAPDITGTEAVAAASGCPAQIALRVWVNNEGAIAIPTGLPVAFYKGDPEAGGRLFGTAATTRPLAAGEGEKVTFIWQNPPSAPVDVYVRVDDDGTGQGLHNECNDAGANMVVIRGTGC